MRMCGGLQMPGFTPRFFCCPPALRSIPLPHHVQTINCAQLRRSFVPINRGAPVPMILRAKPVLWPQFVPILALVSASPVNCSPSSKGVDYIHNSPGRSGDSSKSQKSKPISSIFDWGRLLEWQYRGSPFSLTFSLLWDDRGRRGLPLRTMIGASVVSAITCLTRCQFVAHTGRCSGCLLDMVNGKDAH
jgi:hypothetical protein